MVPCFQASNAARTSFSASAAGNTEESDRVANNVKRIRFIMFHLKVGIGHAREDRCRHEAILPTGLSLAGSRGSVGQAAKGIFCPAEKRVHLLQEFHIVKPAIDERKPDYHVRVVDRALAILEELAGGAGKLGDVALAEKLGLHKSTVHRLVAVLQRNGFVEREPASTKYRLGWRIFELGMVAAAGLDILERAKPFV